MTKENAAPTILFFIFLTLKLCHVITWSWWFVFAPVWGPFLLALVLIGIKFWALKRETPGQRAARSLNAYAKSLKR